MAKDPAFLFYPGDYIAGTMHLDFQCKGAYMDLLMLQFQKDKLTGHMIKHMLGHMYEQVWPHISDKFKTDGQFFWNERLQLEKEKRINFCKSRKENKSYDTTYDKHMSQHMENVNVNRNTIKNKNVLKTEIEEKNWQGEKEKFLQDGSWIFKFCQEVSIGPNDFDLKAKEFLTDIELKEDYKPVKQIRSHFINWFKKQKNGKGNYQPIAANRKESGAEKFLRRAKEKLNSTGNEDS